ncbi:MAG: hypothetical protein INF91_10105, partial [Alphaproteobacteria bacterium]|nr:hypothetical protein [Alphaproteobacteria bacterium]
MTPQVQQLLAAAGAARQGGRDSEERQLLDEALALAPTHPAVNNARGMRALIDRDFALAETRFLAAVAADPREPGLWMNVATARRSAGNDAGEEEALARALEINQLNFMAQLRLAELYTRTGRAPEAAQRWSNVVQMSAGMPERPPAVLEAMNRGQAYLAEHGRRLAADIDTHLGAAMADAGPDARRFSACMDALLGRRTFFRNECAGIYYPFLPADEFFDKRHFPWLAAI